MRKPQSTGSYCYELYKFTSRLALFALRTFEIAKHSCSILDFHCCAIFFTKHVSLFHFLDANLVGKDGIAMNAFPIRAANMEPAEISRTVANATKDGEAYSATSISITAPITNRAKTVPLAEIRDKARILAPVLRDTPGKIASPEYPTNVRTNHASTEELVK